MLLQWSGEIKVTYPDKEVKTYTPTNEESPLTLGKYGWTCTIDKSDITDDNKYKIANRSIFCSQGKGRVSMTVGCIKPNEGISNSPYLNFNLSDARGDYRVITAFCTII